MKGKVRRVTESNIKEQNVEIVTKNYDNFAAQIPDHVILRLAKFLLPKMQKELETEKDAIGTFEEETANVYDSDRKE